MINPLGKNRNRIVERPVDSVIGGPAGMATNFNSGALEAEGEEFGGPILNIAIPSETNRGGVAARLEDYLQTKKQTRKRENRDDGKQNLHEGLKRSLTSLGVRLLLKG